MTQAQTNSPKLFRFRCPKCNIRLKTETFNKGRFIVCPQCKNAITVERRGGISEESVVQRLNESVQQWVRTQCSCGKLVKAPANFAGRTGACPQCGKTIKMPELGSTISSALEVSTFVQAPSEESLLMAMGNDEALKGIHDKEENEPKDKPPTPKQEVTYSRIAPIQSDPSDREYLRAFCICGAEVHAEVDMAGKSVNCPKCGNLLHLPYKPLKRPLWDFDAMAAHDLSFGGESITFKPHQISGDASFYREIDPSKEAKAVISQAEWNNEKVQRAIRIRSIRGASPLETSARAAALALGHQTDNLKSLIWGNPLSKLITSGILVLLALCLFTFQYLSAWSSIGNELPPMQSATSVNFYDTSAGTVFSVSSDTLPPILAPSQQGKPDQEPAGFIVYQFTCTSCDASDNLFPGLLETMTDPTRAGWKRRMEVTGIPKVTPLLDPDNKDTRGRLISKPGTLQWVEAGSPEGLALLKSATDGKCPQGQTAKWCR